MRFRSESRIRYLTAMMGSTDVCDTVDLQARLLIAGTAAQWREPRRTCVLPAHLCPRMRAVLGQRKARAKLLIVQDSTVNAFHRQRCEM